MIEALLVGIAAILGGSFLLAGLFALFGRKH